MTEEIIKVKWIAGFWKRIAAFLIDILILGIFGYLLGIAFESIFVAVGGWGRFIGFLIALTYFGVMGSKFSGGQTIGKKLLKIKVVNSDNESIGIARSFGRYAVLLGPFFLNGAHFTIEVITSYLTYPLSFIIFGGMLSTMYLYLFNRVTRQSLHDLISGTFVVNSNVHTEPEKITAVWNIHLIVVSIVFIAAIIAPVFIKQVATSALFKDLLAAQTALANDPSVQYASISMGTKSLNSSATGTSTTTYVNAQVFLKQNNISDINLARRLAMLVIAKYPEAKTSNSINITLTYGYDLGISSKWNSYTHPYNPVDLSGLE